MVKKNNRLILKSKRKRTIKRVLILTMILMVGGIIFATKSNFFNIKKVSILGNPIMSGEDLKTKTENLIGQNIFLVNKRNIINEAKKNPYVENIEIKKVYPKEVDIKISEKQGIYYIDKDGRKYVLDGETILLEETDNVENRKLVNIIGLEIKNTGLGNKVIDNSRMLNLLDIFYQIIKNNPTNYDIDSIDVSDLMNIKVYIGKIEGKLGNDENITDKMNKLMHIIENSSIGITEGYIDVGFNGAPVYYKKGR